MAASASRTTFACRRRSCRRVAARLALRALRSSPRAAHAPLEPRAGAAVDGDRQERDHEGYGYGDVDRVEQGDACRVRGGGPCGGDREDGDPAENGRDAALATGGHTACRRRPEER